MFYEIDYINEQDYIMVTVTGDLTLPTLKELAVDVAGFIEQYGCNRILNDMRQANLTGDAFNIYNMPKTASQAGIGPHCRRALLVSELSSDFHFLETVFINQGHIVKIFTDLDEALRWLLNKETPKHESGH